MKRRLKNMLIVGGFVVLAIVVSLLLQVEDWSRDLSTNRAATSADTKDDSLRTLEVSADEEAVRAAILEFVERTPAWSIDEISNDEDPVPSIALVRTSRLFRFNDDVDVYLQPTEDGTQIDVTSQSRVGKGDLGQNPRNIRKLLGELTKILAAK